MKDIFPEVVIFLRFLSVFNWVSMGLGWNYIIRMNKNRNNELCIGNGRFTTSYSHIPEV